MSNDRQYLIAGNWKMNMLKTDGMALAAAIAEGSAGRSCELLVCPPAQLLFPVRKAIGDANVSSGAQDCAIPVSGAHTGDISAAMIVDAGASHVILGHSERRADHGEDDATVCAKVKAAQEAGLMPVVCVGETEGERDEDRTMSVISAQLEGSVPESSTAADLVIAYEPVWAIGTGRTATPEQAQEVHAHIRGELARLLGDAEAEGTRILYGGSMKPTNAAELLAQPDVDGGLIGGASLKAEDFLAIADAADARVA